MAFAGLLAALSPFNTAAAVDYAREVKPLLRDRCSSCHGATHQKGGLRVDTAAAAIQGGDAGPAIKLGDASASLLVRAIEGTAPDISRMPYKKPPLSDSQIALLKSWIAEGAKAPADEQPETPTHWSFVAPQPTTPPKVKQVRWARNTIDQFILARLESQKISPSSEADRTTLIRRASLDLIGLPPTPEEVTAFLADKRPDAFERIVERLLASPHYGERWGRWWLDAARYGDSNGYSIDAPRQMWKYRDWVIDALNRDLPFDQFATFQLAGDLLPGATIEQRVATGFHRNTQINQEGGIDPEQFRIECVMDRVNTTGTVFLGLTIGCAQCHDHKFDPITQREYYQLFAFFNSTAEDGHGKGTPGAALEIPGELEALDGIQKQIEELAEDLERYINTQGSAVREWEASLTDELRAKLKPDVKAAIEVAFDQRSPKQKRIVYGAFRGDDPEFKSRASRLAKLEKREPKAVTTLVMEELKEPRPTHLLIKGDFTRPGDKVTPGMPAVLHPMSASPAATDRPLNRLDLATWLVDPANPLTGRVIVNRVWQHYFGRGIVETENDFGTQGSLPTHPELLDWLAREFVANGWSLKKLHRLIVTSATYRQSSRARPDLDVIDPTNKLLARQTRLRLDAEVVRDVALASSELLSPKVGGPPVFPPQPDGVMSLGQVKRDWKPSTGGDRFRRAIYTHFWRATPHPALAVFDAPDGFSACTRRIRSNTPLQALTLLNDQQFHEMAEALARRALAEDASSDSERLDRTFQLCLARKPDSQERTRLAALLKEQSKSSGTKLEAWTTVARVLLNLDETITRE